MTVSYINSQHPAVRFDLVDLIFLMWIIANQRPRFRMEIKLSAAKRESDRICLQ